MTDELDTLDPNIRWIVSEARRPAALGADARARLMDAIRAEPAPARQPAPVAWLMQPRAFVLPPLATLAAAAGLVGIGIFGGLAYNRDGRPSIERSSSAVVNPPLPDSVAPRVVKFVLVAPQAARVAVVGDFNGWDSAATPAERQPDGTWATFGPLAPGRHVYSFIVDGQFVSDPSAPIAPADGYGQRNSVMIVGGRSS